jgi:hypothetical protein
MRRIRRVLAVGMATLAVAAGAIAATPTPATAATSIICANQGLYLTTGYGQLWMCVEIDNSNGLRGRPTLRSFENNTFTPQSGYVPFAFAEFRSFNVIADGDTVSHPFQGYGEAVTGFGNLYYGTQFWENSPYGPIGRWGTLALSENPPRFHPSSDWQVLLRVP